MRAVQIPSPQIAGLVSTMRAGKVGRNHPLANPMDDVSEPVHGAKYIK